MSVIFNVLSCIFLLVGLKRHSIFSLIASLFMFKSVILGLIVIHNALDVIDIFVVLMRVLTLFCIGIIYGLKKAREVSSANDVVHFL